MSTNGEPDVIYADLNAGDGPMEIESMCPSCEENGTTRLLLTNIPNYKEVIIMSFTCDDCGYCNNELQSGARVDEQGVRLTLRVQTAADLNRQVIRSEYAQLCIPEVDLEIAAKTQSGSISTVEGVVQRVKDGLMSDQPRRRELHPDQAVQIEEYCKKLDELLSGTRPFTITIDDCSGHAFIESATPMGVDRDLIIVRYTRTLEQDKLLALVADDAEEQPPSSSAVAEEEEEFNAKAEVLIFKTPCHKCGEDSETDMKVVDIPHFKEMIIMSSVCESCGHRATEAKTGGGIAAKACKFTLNITKPEDLNRDVLKSDTCHVGLPELEIDAGMAAINGRLTTVEGLLVAVRDQMRDECRMWLGDSAESTDRDRLDALIAQLDLAIDGRRSLTLIMDDPSGNSYIERLSDTTEGDDRLLLELTERTAEQNDDLGISDMKTENYEEEDKS